MLLMSASAPVAARPCEPPGTQWSGTQLGTLTTGAGKAKPGPWVQSCPSLAHVHTGAAPRHRLGACTALASPAPASASVRTSGRAPTQGRQPRQPPNTPTLPGVAALIHSLQPQMQTGQEPTSTRSALQASRPAQPGSGHRAGTSSIAGASRRPGCFSCLPPALLCRQALRNPLGTNCRQTCNPKAAHTAISQGLPRLCHSPYAALHPQQP